MSEQPAPAGRAPVGRRQIVVQNQTGQPSYSVQPLGPVDFLSPQPGDEFFHGPRHDAAVRRLWRLFRHLYRYSPSLGVLSGAQIIWADSRFARPRPDLVIASMADPQRPRPELDLAAENAALRLVFEVTSPGLAQVDLDEKPAVYAQAGVPEYFILDLSPEGDASAAGDRLLAYRLAGGEYQPVAPDGEGRIYSESTKVWCRLLPSGEVELIEARTGRPVMPPEGDDEPPVAAQIEAALRAQSIASQLGLPR